MIKQIASITIKRHKIDDIVKCLEEAGFVVMIESCGFLEGSFMIAEACDSDEEVTS